MTLLKNNRKTPTLLLTTAVAVTMLVSSCGMYTASVKSENANTTIVNYETQFIEDFYLNSTEELVVPSRLDINYSQNNISRKHRPEPEIQQLPISEELAILGENIRLGENAENENIGGLDYTSPQDAEDFESYEELFATNELNAGEIFDPAKMIDSIQVFLVSPRSNCYTFPLEESKINSDFGWRHSRFHSGIDLDLETGDNVFNAFDGIVNR